MEVDKWRSVPAYEQEYQVSSTGSVYSLLTDKYLKPWPGKQGYLCVTLCKSGHKKHKPVHQLVLLAFHGPRPIGRLSRHRNGNHLDNRSTNLLWGTVLENNRDTVRHGHRKANHGSLNPRSKLHETWRPSILARLAAGETQHTIALDYGVSQSTISLFVCGKTYSRE